MQEGRERKRESYPYMYLIQSFARCLDGALMHQHELLCYREAESQTAKLTRDSSAALLKRREEARYRLWPHTYACVSHAHHYVGIDPSGRHRDRASVWRKLYGIS